MISGWNLKLAFHDPMHMVFLGVCRDLYASSLGYWIRNDFFGTGTVSERLRQFSEDLRAQCRQEKIRVGFKRFTLANTGLDKASHFPELGSIFKAAFLKSALWFFAKKAIDIAEQYPHDDLLKPIATCHWHLYAAIYALDHADLVLDACDAQEVGQNFEIHLVSWQHIASQCEMKGLRLYKLRPKHHYMDHTGEDVKRTHLNCLKLMACFNDESFLGYLKRIGIRCHSSKMMERLFQRYLLFLGLRWRDAAEGVEAAQ